MTLLESATRIDSMVDNNCILDELMTEWTLNIRDDEVVGQANCNIYHRIEDYRIHRGWRQYIYIDDLRSDVPGYGTRLFEAVLEYLDTNYPGIPIALHDVSEIKREGRSTSLRVISLLKRGEFSYYERFGFKPYPSHKDTAWTDDQSWRLQYDQHSQKIKSMSSRDMVESLNRYSHDHPTECATRWIDALLEVLSGRDDKLMIDEIRDSNVDLTTLKMKQDPEVVCHIDEGEFDRFILSEWGITYDDEQTTWVR